MLARHIISDKHVDFTPKVFKLSESNGSDWHQVSDKTLFIYYYKVLNTAVSGYSVCFYFCLWWSAHVHLNPSILSKYLTI